MSVLIKGMEMPEDCFSCPLKEEGFCNITNAYAGQIYERNSDCPLVEVPTPHGRLVDVDAFKADYGMKDDCADCEKECQGKTRACEYDRIYSKMDFCSWLDVADVVIEAEVET